MEECTFCKIYESKKEIIYENNHFYAMFDAHPVSPGHSLVIPKRHVVSLLDLNEKEWASLQSAIRDTIKIIEKTNLQELYKEMNQTKVTQKSPWFCERMLKHPGLHKKADAYNIGNNDGEAAGRTIHHLHIQIIPRYKGDVKDPIGGIRQIIPGLGNYK
jgi:diadenosine tetraphosphate (Ap4A) HIT family hydrolase